MKMKEIVKPPKGTYAALRVSKASRDDIYSHCQETGINVDKRSFDNRLHVTLIYSRKHCPEMIAQTGRVHSCTFKDYEIFSGGDGKKVLVALLDASSVVARHVQLMALHSATYDYPVYHPHITLSYDYTGNDFSKLLPMTFPIYLDNEYVEDLDLDWQ